MKTILLVDDEEILCESTKEALEMEGYAVIVATNGNDALEMFALHNVDLVITDVVMPGMDGVDLVSRLRATWPDIPIISISGGSRVVSARFGLDSTLLAGANASLSKPFTHQQLFDKVKQLLNG